MKARVWEWRTRTTPVLGIATGGDFCPVKIFSHASTGCGGVVRVGRARGVSAEGVEAIEGAFGGIHVDDQFDQSSRIFQLAAPCPIFFSVKMEKSVEISSSKKKIGSESNSYWTGRTGRRDRFGSFSPRCAAKGVRSRIRWVGHVIDPPLPLCQSPLKIFFF